MEKGKQEIITPIKFVRAVEELFNIKFKYDMAATAKNARAPRYFTPKDDSLSNAQWPVDGWIWLNPPFKNLSKWVLKCSIEMKRGAKIVSIWPLSSDRNQIRAWTMAGVYIIHGRIWPLVRGCMLCFWSYDKTKKIRGLDWDGEGLERIW